MKIFVLILLVAASWVPSLGSLGLERIKLIKHLSEISHEDAEPENAHLKFGVAFLCARYDHEDKVMKTSAWERYSWTDSRLAWNPDEYGGVKVIRISSDHIWRPDFKLYNSLSAEDKRQSSKCVVQHTGEVIWVPAVEYKSLCRHTNETYQCNYMLGSWAIDSTTLPLSHWELGELNYYHNTTCPLLPTLESAQVFDRLYPCCPDKYASLEMMISYKRNEACSHGRRFHGRHSYGHEHGAIHGDE